MSNLLKDQHEARNEASMQQNAFGNIEKADSFLLALIGFFYYFERPLVFKK